MSEFTDILFKQLYETQPRIALELEAGQCNTSTVQGGIVGWGGVKWSVV